MQQSRKYRITGHSDNALDAKLSKCVNALVFTSSQKARAILSKMIFILLPQLAKHERDILLNSFHGFGINNIIRAKKEKQLSTKQKELFEAWAIEDQTIGKLWSAMP